jgi:hypothetical protein
MGQPEVIILHDGPRYRVRFLRCSAAKDAVICFEYWKPQPSLAGEFSAEGFFRHRNTNAIGILAAENDWFQHDEIRQVLAAIRDATQGFDLVGYGGSMGGYAAINFADLLRLRSLIAVCPQYSIDAARAPYEPRWRQEAARIAETGGFAHDRINQVPRLARGWLIFDPGCVDARHVADIQRHHALAELKNRLGGHEQMLMLQQADLYTGMLLDMLEDRFDPAAFTRTWRVARRRSATYWLGLSALLLRRGHAQGALRAARLARALPHPEPAAVDLAEAAARLALGDGEAARALCAPWVEHPGWGYTAAPLLARIPPPAPPGLWRRLAGPLRRIGRA